MLSGRKILCSLSACLYGTWLCFTQGININQRRQNEKQDRQGDLPDGNGMGEGRKRRVIPFNGSACVFHDVPDQEI